MVALTKPAKLLLETAQGHDERANIEEMKFSINYLTTFGYLAKFAWDNRDEILKAVKKFQSFFGGLKKDSVVGPKTLRAMQMPRCGCPDFIVAEEEEHQEYAALVQFARENLSKWNKKGLKYYIKSYVGGLSQSEQRDILAGAWKAWDDVCGISVSRTSRASEADLICDTGSGRRSNFDGPGGTLAWAYLPNGSDRQLLMRFDLAETWISNPRQRGILLFNVACHEFGHMLGLTHSRKNGALMAPYYNPNVPVPQWDDDIPRVQARYGKNVDRPEPPTTPPTNPPSAGETFNVTCKDLKVDGYTLFANG